MHVIPITCWSSLLKGHMRLFVAVSTSILCCSVVFHRNIFANSHTSPIQDLIGLFLVLSTFHWLFFPLFIGCSFHFSLVVLSTFHLLFFPLFIGCSFHFSLVVLSTFHWLFFPLFLVLSTFPCSFYFSFH